jgi:hypothetical protein
MRARWWWPGLLAVLGVASASGQWVREYVLELAPESEADRALRHQLVAERRAGPVIMVHRGASAAAAENTLQACATALDWGADGVEVDVRRTRDGVLVLFHDEHLDRLTRGLGTVAQLTAAELLALPPRTAFGRAAGGTVPSFVQLLDLVRQRAALLHLDLKEPGLEDEVARWLDAADAWDHVVAVNEANAPRLARDPRLRLLRYKVPGLYEDRRDVDPDAVRAALRQPGEMILVDDPRVAAWVLDRPRYRPVPVLRTFRLVPRRVPPEPAAEPGPFNPAAHMAALARSTPPDSALALLQLIQAAQPGRAEAGSDQAALDRLAARIVERAWAADQLGALGRRHRDVVRALEELVRQPTPHPDWRYHALDGALAARALGRLGSTASAPVLVAALRERVARWPAAWAAEAGTNLAAWAEARFNAHLLAALGDLRCRTARRFLLEFLAPERTRSPGWEGGLWEEAARALLQQHLSGAELRQLLRHPLPAVRGIAILECVDRANAERRRALTAEAAWALNLPAAPALPPPPAPPPRLVRAGVTAPPKGAP